MRVKVCDFPSSFHGLIEIRKVKPKFLRRVIEFELSKRADIPKPFVFSYKIYEELEDRLKVSVCVVSKDRIDSILSSDPEVDIILTEEVAYFSFLCKRFKGPAWGGIIGEDSISLFLYHKGCLIYSTKIPFFSKFDHAVVESVNSVLRHAAGIVEPFPERIFIKGEVPQDFLEKIIIDAEVLSETYEVEIDLVKDYNLIPVEVLKERRFKHWEKRLSLALSFINLSLLVFICYTVWQYHLISVKINRNERVLKKAASEIQSLYALRDIYNEKKAFLNLLKDSKKSFYKFLHLYSIYSLIHGEGIKIKSIEIKGNVAKIEGSIEANSRSVKYVKFLNLLSLISHSGFKILNRDLILPTGVFNLSLELPSGYES